jgi:hypothetical protein
MLTIHKKILTDEAMRPLAVQIDYQDWLEIERRLTKAVQLDSLETRLARIHERVRRYVPAGRSLADELIAERREEAERE